ncbi:MAG: glutamate--tRNA ligase [Candidatus Yonathbacteria bacterium]|nr:glutamate--tRNA ligase [Candidatus Yonathbacteria bacterium]
MSEHEKKVVTRFAPSPTGVLHVGGVRTALFSWLFARKYGGEFVLRIEDTDTERSTSEFEKDIIDGLSWLGITHDRFYRQSERVPEHRAHLERMLAEGAVYEAEDNKDGTGKVIRFKNTNETITFTDVVRGDITFDTTELGDFVIARDIDHPLYHLAVVADDFDMGVTHVIRGEDGISNTPRQILIGRAMGAPRPVYAHIPLILAPDKSKLSKRHGAVSATAYRDKGYLPEALLNFLALLGWNPGDEREIFTLTELVQEFSLERIQKSGAVFSTEKLDWINREHIKCLSKDIALTEVVRRFEDKNPEVLAKVAPLILERVSVWSDIDEFRKAGEFEYFFTAPVYDAEGLLWKESPAPEAWESIDNIINMLQSVSFESPETIKSGLWTYAEERGKGAVLWPFRYALSGREKSADPFTIAWILGRDETLARLGTAKENLETLMRE